MSDQEAQDRRPPEGGGPVRRNWAHTTRAGRVKTWEAIAKAIAREYEAHLTELHDRQMEVMSIARMAAPCVHPRLANVDFVENPETQRVMALPD